MPKPLFGISALQLMHDAEKLSTRHVFRQDIMCKDTDNINMFTKEFLIIGSLWKSVDQI